MALFFTYVLPLLLPTAIYMLWRLIAGRHPADSAGSAADDTGGTAAITSGDDLWRDMPWLWLAIAGAVLLAIVLLIGVFFHGSPPQGHYVPPRMENGQIVPGELRPDESTTERSGASPGGAPSGVQ